MACFKTKLGGICVPPDEPMRLNLTLPNGNTIDRTVNRGTGSAQAGDSVLLEDGTTATVTSTAPAASNDSTLEQVA